MWNPVAQSKNMIDRICFKALSKTIQSKQQRQTVWIEYQWMIQNTKITQIFLASKKKKTRSEPDYFIILSKYSKHAIK